MAARKGSGTFKAEKTVDETLFTRSSFRRPVARENVEDVLKHTRRVLERAARRRRVAK